MACRGGGGLGPPNPEHKAVSKEAKATANKTPSQSTVPVKSPLMEGQEKGTKTRIGRGLTNDPKEESSDMQDSSSDPTDPLPPPSWAEIESIKGNEPEGWQSLDEPSKKETESRSPDPEEANPFTLARLQTSIGNLQRLSEGNLEYAGLLLSEIAHYPLPPKVVKQILVFENDTETQLLPEFFTTSQLSTAILDSNDNMTPQWYIEPLERHIQQLQHVAAVMDGIGPKLKTWYESTDGEVASAGLFLTKLAPEPDRGKPLPNGMTQLLLRTEKGAQKYLWPQLTACLARSLDVQHTTASISWILEELLPPTDQAGTGIPPTPQATHSDMDPSRLWRI